MNKKSISLVLALTLSLTFVSIGVLADPYSDKAAYEKELEENKKEYKTAQEQVDEIEAKVQEVNSRMEDITYEIEELATQIDEVQGKIDDSNEKVQATTNDIEEESDLFGKRMRSMYINGIDSYIEVLFESKGLTDFLSRLTNIKTIINHDTKLINSLIEKKDIIVAEKAIIEIEKVKLDELQEENNVKLAELEVKKEEQRVALAAAEENRDLFKAAMDETQEQLNETLALINSYTSGNDEDDRPNRGDGGYVPPSATGNAIVDYAMQFIGVPYVWGGSSPSGFDCSGLTSYVYRACGISIPRIANDQMNGGAYISRDQLQPGDLVFFGSGGYAYHVGIYVGNNSYLHAPQQGETVKISPMGYRKDYLQGRRYN